MEPNPYEPPPDSQPSGSSSKPLNLRRGARRRPTSFRHWLGQLGILTGLMIVGGVLGYFAGFLTEGAMIGVGAFVVLVLVRESRGRKR